MARRGLTDKQRLFVQEYLKTLNATQAYKKVYGVSQKAAEASGPRLLGNVRVADVIQNEKAKLHSRTEITAERTLREYARLGYSRMDSFARWGPSGVTLKDSDDLSEDDTACVAEVSQTWSENGGSIKFKLHDKKGALDFLAKHLGIQGEDKISVNIHENLDPARDRLATKLAGMAKRQAEGETNGSGRTVSG